MIDLWIVQRHSLKYGESKYVVFEGEQTAKDFAQIGDYLIKIPAEKQEPIGEVKKVFER